MTQVVGIVGRGQSSVWRMYQKAMQAAEINEKMQPLELEKQLVNYEQTASLWLTTFGNSLNSQQQREREIFEKPRRKRRGR